MSSIALWNEILALAERAGEAILALYMDDRSSTFMHRKQDDSPFTAADHAANEILLSGLSRLPENFPVVSEEGPDASEIPQSGPWWLVDPLDGTKEFLKRTGDFTVNVALIYRGRPVGGVVHAPALGRSWIGRAGGAEVRENGTVRPLSVSEANLERLRVVASRDHTGPAVRRLLTRHRGAEAVRMGSSLKFCLLAEGRADIYFRDAPTMEWDTAAAHAVLRAAGGEVYSMEGGPMRYGKVELRNDHFVAVGDRALPWRHILNL